MTAAPVVFFAWAAAAANTLGARRSTSVNVSERQAPTAVTAEVTFEKTVENVPVRLA